MKVIKIIIVICVLFFFGCVSEPVHVNRDDQKRADVINAEHIIFIGFDGFGSNFLPKSNMPNLKQMIVQGSSAMNMINVLPPVSTANWLSLFIGTPHNKKTSENFPSILSVLNDAGKSIAYFYEWHGMKEISDLYNIESFYIDPNYESTLKAAQYIKENKPAFTSIVYSEPDNTGHKKWFGTKAYYKKLELLDSFIPIITQAAIDSGIYDKTVFIISTDHGGVFWEHQVNLKSIRNIPFIICGKGIKKDYKILTASRIFDIAPTMAVILGLDVPSEWTGSPLWEIFD